MSDPSNRVRELREARGLTQVGLAAAARLSRQSVSAIEAGRATPAVDVALRLARALESDVEALFGTAARAPVSAEATEPRMHGRVALAHLAGRFVAYPLERDGMHSAADGIVARALRGRLDVELLGPPAAARDNVILMGCAGALGLLADRLNGRAGAGRFRWLERSSTQALAALGHHATHIAGVHLVDAATGAANVVDVRRQLRHADVVLITLGRWEAGLVTAPGNPKRIRGAADLGRRGLRVVTREPGSGAQRLLESELAKHGIAHALAGRGRDAPPNAPPALCARGHLDVARIVLLGAADVGVATRDAALSTGLAFVPLAEERYDLALAPDALDDARICRLFEVLTSAPLRRELAALGYDVRAAGERVTEGRAA